VRVNTSVRDIDLSASSSTSSARLLRLSTWITRCVTLSTVKVVGETDTLAGSRNISAASFPISGGIVAEKKRFWRRADICETMRRIGGRKPRSSILSASSSTRISVAARLILRSAR
jgi:hypothetical protein